MQSTQTYRAEGKQRAASDMETFIGNTLAVLLAGLGVASGFVGLLVAFGYIDTSINTPFENGVIWMIGGVILAIGATVFRREHHIVDDANGRPIVYDETVPRPNARR